MLDKTKYTIEKLKRAGLNRKDFSAKLNKATYKVDVVLKPNKEKLFNPEIVKGIVGEGFSLIYIISPTTEGNCKINYPIIQNDRKGQLLFWNMAEVSEEFPKGKFYKIEDLNEGKNNN